MMVKDAEFKQAVLRGGQEQPEGMRQRVEQINMESGDSYWSDGAMGTGASRLARMPDWIADIDMHEKSDAFKATTATRPRRSPLHPRSPHRRAGWGSPPGAAGSLRAGVRGRRAAEGEVPAERAGSPALPS